MMKILPVVLLASATLNFKDEAHGQISPSSATANISSTQSSQPQQPANLNQSPGAATSPAAPITTPLVTKSNSATGTNGTNIIPDKILPPPTNSVPGRTNVPPGLTNLPPPVINR